MAQLVDIPNVGRVEFPDGMSTDDITKAIHNDILKTPTQAQGSTIGNFATGLGRGIQDVGQGLKQLGLGALGTLGVMSPDSQSNYTKQVDAERAAYDASPVGQSTAGNVGRFIGNVAPAFAIPGGIAGSLATRMGTGALAGAGLGATQYVPEDGSRALNTGIGGILGGAAPIVTGALAKGYNAVKGNVIDPAAQAILDQGKKWGVRLGIDDVVNSPFWKSTSQWLEELPFIGNRGFRAAQNEEAKNAAQGFLGNLENQMRSTEFNKPEIYNGWKDTRGQGLIFHGTQKPITDLQEGYLSKQDLFGRGLNTTDSIADAASYAGPFPTMPNNNGLGYIYKVTEKNSVPLAQLDEALTSKIKKDLWPFAKQHRLSKKELEEILADYNTGSLADTYANAFIDYRSYPEFSGADGKIFAMKQMGMIDDYLKAKNYRGVKVGQDWIAPHDNINPYTMRMYFDPKNDLEISQINPKDFMNKQTLETIAQSGGKRSVEAQKLLNDIANAGDDWQKTTETSARLNLLNKQLQADQKYGLVENMADRYGAVPITNTLKSLDDTIASEKASFAPDSNVLNFATKMRDNITNGQYSYSQLRKDQSRLGAMIADANQGKNSLIGTQGAATVQNIRNAVRKDMDTFAQSQNPELTKAWKDADSFYRNNVTPFKDIQLAKALTGNAPDEIYSKFITSGGTEGGKGTTRAAKLYNALDPKGQAAVRYGMAKNAFDKAYNPDTGAFSPAKFASEFDKIAAAKGVFFQGPAKAEIDGFKNLMRHVERSNVAINKPETGVRAIPYLVGGALAGGAYIDPSSTLGVLTSAYGLKKLMTTPAGRNFLLSASKFKAGSPQMQKALDKFISAAQLGAVQSNLSTMNREEK